MFHIFGTRVDLRLGEPAGLEAEGLVVAANDHLWMGSGAALALKQAGGEEIEIEAVRQGPLTLGSAVATGAGKLGFRRAYHAVVMGQDQKTRQEALEPALKAALGLAGRDRLASLAIAPLESEELAGAFREAAGHIVAALSDALGGETALKSVTLVVSKEDSREAYRRAFHEWLGGGHR